MSHNVLTEIKNGKLVITVDISKPILDKAPFSKTGKNRLVASSSGMMDVPNTDGIRIGLNVITK